MTEPRIDPHAHTVHYGDFIGRCSSIEGRYMRVLGLTYDQIEAVMRGPIGPVIVGEAPGENTADLLPMFPYPRGSAGGRLLTISSLPAFDYLRTFHRVNLMTSYSRSWDVRMARSRAMELVLAHQGHPLVLLGTRVREAFEGLGGSGFVPFRWAQRHGCWLTALPHPSGRNLLTNDTGIRRDMRLCLMEAVDLWRRPRGLHDRGSCNVCGRLIQVHDRHPSDSALHVTCAGETMRFCYPMVYRT